MIDPFPELSGFPRLLAVMRRLRSPDGGCPWDLKQTHQSLAPYVLEEAYEVVEAIQSGDEAHLKDELGDLLLQVAFHAQLAAERGLFTADTVADGIADKLVRRHPHVFGDVSVQDADEVTVNWARIKAQEKGETDTEHSAMAGISAGMPALSRALLVSRRAVAEGFEWPNWESLWACVMSEFDEFRQALATQASAEHLEEELGDILFATVNLARTHGIDPEVALTRATHKFMARYRLMEHLSEKPLREQSFEQMDTLWNQAKKVHAQPSLD
jgi:MazG family protein